MKIFVSAKMRGAVLARERASAISAIDSTDPLARAWAWERDTSAGPYSSLQLCVGQARTSDGLVLIVSEDLTYATRREYHAARRAGAPTYVFVKSNVAQTPALDRFVKRVRGAGVVTRPFANLSELEVEIKTALYDFVVRAARTEIARARGIAE